MIMTDMTSRKLGQAELDAILLGSEQDKLFSSFD